MTHYWALVVFLAALAVLAFAADVDQELRSTHRPQESHADLGENYGEPVHDYDRPRRTPTTTRKAPPVAASEARIRNTTSQQH